MRRLPTMWAIVFSIKSIVRILRSVLKERKFVHVAVQVLLAHEVVDAVMTALKERPEVF